MRGSWQFSKDPLKVCELRQVLEGLCAATTHAPLYAEVRRYKQNFDESLQI